MKKTLLLFLAIATCFASFAKKHKIQVSNFQFSPATTNAVVGDTIVFTWVSGTHTTTSTTIPTGAASWDKPMTSTNKKFTYVLTKKGTYHFICTIHSNMMGSIKVTKALTADFSFSDISAENAKAFLNWNITDAKNLSYFSVQRSTDGENFKEIAKLNASALNNYQFTDAPASTSKFYYYQIEMFDKDGNAQLSDIKMFDNSAATKKLITSISPNPVSNPGHLMLQFNADAEGKMLVQLYTQSGRLVNQTEMAANKGLNNGHFHLGNLTPGSYYLICTFGNQKEKHAILFQ